MKKKLFYLSFFLLLVMILSFFIPSNKKENNERLKILSTTVMIDNLVKEIVKDYYKTDLLMEGEIDPHSYQMRKGDREKIQSANVVFANGLSLEHNPSLFYLLKSKGTIFLGDRILEKKPELIITTNKEIDPHIWMDLYIMKEVADYICEVVSKNDPIHAEIYKRNTNNLKQKMTDLDKKIFSMIKNIPEENRYIVSSHDAFNYFVRRYFQEKPNKRLFSMQGLSPECEVSLKRINQVVDFIKNHHVFVIFYESNLPRDSIWKVMELCKGFGINIKISKDPLYGDTLGGMSYLEMLEHNGTVITSNLMQQEKVSGE